MRLLSTLSVLSLLIGDLLVPHHETGDLEQSSSSVLCRENLNRSWW